MIPDYISACGSIQSILGSTAASGETAVSSDQSATSSSAGSGGDTGSASPSISQSDDSIFRSAFPGETGISSAGQSTRTSTTMASAATETNGSLVRWRADEALGRIMFFASITTVAVFCWTS